MSEEKSNKNQIKETVIAGIVTGFFFVVCFITLAVTSIAKTIDRILITVGRALDQPPPKSEKEKS